MSNQEGNLVPTLSIPEEAQVKHIIYNINFVDEEEYKLSQKWKLDDPEVDWLKEILLITGIKDMDTLNAEFYKSDPHSGCPCLTTLPNHEILPGLFLGSGRSTTPEFLKENNIKRVLTLCDIELPIDDPEIKHIQHFMTDEGWIGRRGTYQEIAGGCIKFIHEAQKRKENILVRCYCGINRSVTTVICYLMFFKNMTWNEGLQFVKSIRPVADPYDEMKKRTHWFCEGQWGKSLRDELEQERIITESSDTKNSDAE